MRIPFLMRPKHVRREPLTWDRIWLFVQMNALTLGLFAFALVCLTIGFTH